MTKKEYLEELNVALIRLNIDDRADALNYYSEYFDEAGEENTEQVIRELGSPEELARKFLTESGEDVSKKQQLRKRSTRFYCAITISAIAFIIILTFATNFIIHLTKRVSTNVKVNSQDASTEKQQLYEYANDDLPAFKNISIYISNASVEIEPSTNGKYGIELALVIYEDETVTHDVTDVSTLLVQIEEPHNSRSVSKKYGNVKQYVKITVPEDVYGNFELMTSNANLTIALANSSLDRLNATTSNSKIHIADVTCPNIDATTSNDEISVTNVGCNELLASTSNGNIVLSDTYIDSNATLTTSNDDVLINLPGSMDDYTISAYTSNGDITIGDDSYENQTKCGTGPKVISINTSNGDVDISF
ncbi:MAG: DUF4097 family beta strand repeat-containing protein [Lachnospiraceae bacterium]|nr:DUF4097 family beta strand repeat-containing protein [Lachnospiraceae bacterium]